MIQGGNQIDYQSPAGYPQYQLPHIPSLRTKTELLDGENGEKLCPILLWMPMLYWYT